MVNLAYDQSQIGVLDAAESNVMRSIEICREIEDKFKEAVGHQELGRLLAYRGEFEESKKETEAAIKIAEELGIKQNEGLSHAYCSLRSIFMSNAEEAIKSAKKARELADVEYFEIDVIHAEYLLGATNLMKGNLTEAEKHLTEKQRCRVRHNTAAASEASSAESRLTR